MQLILGNGKANTDNHVDIELVSPQVTTIHSADQPNYSTAQIRYKKDWKYYNMPPVIAIKDHNSYEIVDGINRQAQARINKKNASINQCI